MSSNTNMTGSGKEIPETRKGIVRWPAVALVCCLLFLPARSSAQELQTHNLKTASLYYLEKPGLNNENDGSFQLVSGKVLVQARQPLTVSCANFCVHDGGSTGEAHATGVSLPENRHEYTCNLEMVAGTVALISIENGVMRLINLYERRNQSIQVTIGRHRTTVAVGEEVCIAGDIGPINEILRNQPGSRRLIKREQRADAYTILQMEISLQPPLHNDEIVKSLSTSSSSDDRHLYDRLVKMAACVSMARR
jgi:hypothetical protein